MRRWRRRHRAQAATPRPRQPDADTRPEPPKRAPGLRPENRWAGFCGPARAYRVPSVRGRHGCFGSRVSVQSRQTAAHPYPPTMLLTDIVPAQRHGLPWRCRGATGRQLDYVLSFTCCLETHLHGPIDGPN
jgi:hypothetical protein